MQAAEDAVAASTTALDQARRQYEEVSDRVVREFARFRRDKAADMKKIILDYVNVQVRRAEGGLLWCVVLVLLLLHDVRVCLGSMRGCRERRMDVVQWLVNTWPTLLDMLRPGAHIFWSAFLVSTLSVSVYSTPQASAVCSYGPVPELVSPSNDHK